MTRDHVLDDLKKKYTVLGVLDLEDPDLSQALSDLRQPVFAPMDRIIIMQNNSDKYDYPDAPGERLTSLQIMLTKLDISNCFVTVVTGNPSIEKEINQLRIENSLDDLPINFCLAEMPYIKQTQQYNDSFCALPWIHLHVTTNGDILPCCYSDNNRPLGNLRSHSIKQIMQGELATTLKHNMLNGYRSKVCAACYRQEDNGLKSPRVDHNIRYKTITKDDVTLEQYNPIFLDIRLNNLCNFKCRMCSEWYSSSIAQETRQLYGADAKLPYNFVDVSAMSSKQRKETIGQILPLISHQLDKIYFAGGEPLLTDEHYQIMSKLLAIGKTDIEIYYNTNLSTLNYKGSCITDLWNKFENITVGASIDASGTIAEYLRHGTMWDTVVDNLRKIKQQAPKVKIRITSTVGFLNVKNLIDLQRYWITSGFIPPADYNVKTLTSPEFLSVAALPTDHKLRLAQQIQDHIDWCRDVGSQSLADEWAT